MNKRKKWGLILLIGPFALLIGVALLQFVIRFIFASVDGGSGATNPLILVVNIISLIAGVVATIGFLPSIIVGIIFLASSDKKDNQNPTSGSPTN